MRRLEMGDEDVNNYGSPCGAHAAIAAYVDRGGRDAEAVRDLRHADVGIGQHCLGGLNVIVSQFRRTVTRSPPCGSKPRLGALAD